MLCRDVTDVYVLCTDERYHCYVGMYMDMLVFQTLPMLVPFCWRDLTKAVALFASGNALMHKYGDHLTAKLLHWFL